VRVFVSYRRGDAVGHAVRLHDELAARLGTGSVFQDVASIAPGANGSSTRSTAPTDGATWCSR
jgi:hypothetical protein